MSQPLLSRRTCIVVRFRTLLSTLHALKKKGRKKTWQPVLVVPQGERGARIDRKYPNSCTRSGIIARSRLSFVSMQKDRLLRVNRLRHEPGPCVRCLACGGPAQLLKSPAVAAAREDVSRGRKQWHA